MCLYLVPFQRYSASNNGVTAIWVSGSLRLLKWSRDRPHLTHYQSSIVTIALLPRNAMQARPISSCGVYLSVYVSVTFVHFVKTNKDILEIFSPSSQAILVFPYQTAWQYSDGNPPNGGVECRWGRQKSRLWAYIWLHCVLLMLRLATCCQYDAAGPPTRKLWHLSLVVSGDVDSKRRRRNVYDKKRQRYTKGNRTAHLITRSDKSVAYVTNSKRLLNVLYCWI